MAGGEEPSEQGLGHVLIEAAGAGQPLGQLQELLGGEVGLCEQACREACRSGGSDRGRKGVQHRVAARGRYDAPPFAGGRSDSRLANLTLAAKRRAIAD